MTQWHERWHQLEEIFNAARELAPDERESLLRARALDPEVRREIDELLQAHDALDVSGQEDFLEVLVPALDSPLLQPIEDSHDPLDINGKTISHFHVKEYLASGGMGVLYTAVDLQLGRTVALKFPLPHQKMDARVKERFFREARSTAVLDHPNLCTVYEVGESAQGVFMAMPLYKGETLRDRLARESILPLAEAIRITRELAAGLASAHAAGIVHRDMKPGNVMLLPNGAVKILDFGIAKVLDVSLTKSRDTLGTIAYMAPEQISNDPVDGRTDLWAIGVMLYRMLTGKLPFEAETEIAMLHSILHDDPQRASAINVSLPGSLDSVIAGLLQKKASDRYPAAETLLADLDALEQGKAPSHKIPLWKSRVRRGMRVSLFAAAAGILLPIGVASWIIYRTRPVASSDATAPVLKFVNNTAVISTSAELLAAISPANAGKRVHLRAGTYNLDRLLTVPDGMTLEGEGEMSFAREGYATGFRDRPRTTLRMIASAGGDILTLGNNVTLRNLELVDLDGRIGNLVRVESRRPYDSLSAIIVESVLVNPNPFVPSSLSGRALQITTRNARKGTDSPPHDGAVVSVKLLRSVLKSPAGGGGFFAFNFAPNSRISLEISRSLIGGSSEANGGVSNPAAVHDSEVRITSEDNVYRNEWVNRCAQAVTGWNLTGGSGTPVLRILPETARNRVVVRSTNDRIEGFTTGITATGSRRFHPAPQNGASTDNHIDLQLAGTTISTPECPSGIVGSVNAAGMDTGRMDSVSDVRLIGGSVARGSFEPGNGNTVRVELRGVTGSGRRGNRYAHAGSFSSTLQAKLRGKGNRLEIVGDSQTFSRINHAIDPAPGPEFFTAKR
jgi:serine/threonine protein kinase